MLDQSPIKNDIPSIPLNDSNFDQLRIRELIGAHMEKFSALIPLAEIIEKDKQATEAIRQKRNFIDHLSLSERDQALLNACENEIQDGRKKLYHLLKEQIALVNKDARKEKVINQEIKVIWLEIEQKINKILYYLTEVVTDDINEPYLEENSIRSLNLKFEDDINIRLDEIMYAIEEEDLSIEDAVQILGCQCDLINTSDFLLEREAQEYLTDNLDENILIKILLIELRYKAIEIAKIKYLMQNTIQPEISYGLEINLKQLETEIKIIRTNLKLEIAKVELTNL